MANINDIKRAVEQAANLIKNIKSGNLIDAAKNAINLAKNGAVKKNLKWKIILAIAKILIPLLLVVVLATSVLSVFTAVADKMNELKGNITTFTTSVWKWFTNDYWIDIEQEIECVIDEETGETEKETLVDQYMKETEKMGISIKQLRILGDADYTSEEVMNDPNNIKLMKKYLKEFIRADIISQEIHRRYDTTIVGNEPLVNPLNEDEIDGGTFLYRSANELSGGTSLEKERMTYKSQTEFEAEIEKINNGTSNSTKISNWFTIDETTGELIYAQVNTVETYKKTGGKWVYIDTKVTVEQKKCDYKSVISKYTLPYEFLVNLCMITQNPEFVYRVALMARDTNIHLVILDNTTKVTDIIEEEITTTTLTNNGSSSPEGASSSESTDEIGTKTITTQTNPQVVVEKVVDSWIYKGEKTYTNKKTEVQYGPDESQGEIESVPTQLEDTGTTVKVKVKDTTETSESSTDEKNEGDKKEKTKEVDVKVYSSSYISEHKIINTTITESNNYEEGPVQNEIIKSDDFLGLLRNKNGEAIDENEFKNGKRIPFKEEGKNVAYRIPNTTIEEMPLNKLISGAEMLFGQLRRNTRTQGQEQLMRYLLQFPTGKDYGVTKEELFALFKLENPGEGSMGGSTLWWPIEEGVNYRISSPFGIRKSPGGIGSTNHKGIDIAVAEGTKIIAAGDGVVEIAKNSDSAGLYIRIDHGNGLKTVYMHNSKLLVQVGQVVKKGDVIALSGNTGNSTGPHLHFGVMMNGQYVDPMNYVNPDNPRPEVGDYSNAVPVDDMDLLCAIVASECATSYEGSLAVISCVLNRCDQNWGNHGTDPISQITAKSQFSYGIPQYQNAHKRYLNGKAPEHTKQAVNDALAGRARNHSYTSFRTDSAQARRNHPNGKEIGGNWFFN